MVSRLPTAFVPLALVAVPAAQSPRLVTDLDSSPQSNLGSEPRDPLSVGTSVYFSALAPSTGRELYFMDSSTAVVQVGDIWPGAAGSDPIPLVEVNNRLLFSADDGVNGRELWQSSPLVRLGDMNPGTGAADPVVLGRIGSSILLCADDGVHGRVLWVTTGGVPSLVSTVVVDRDTAVVAGNTLFFVGDDGVTGTELWKSDGTPAGTVRVRDITPGAAGTQIWALLAIQSNVYFVGGIPWGFGHSEDLYLSDGTTANLLPIRPGGNARPSRLTVVGTTLMFFADDGSHGNELWRANGSTVSLAADIRPGSASSAPEYAFVTLGPQLFFWADDGVHGLEPWSYSTVTSQAQLFADLASGPLGTNDTQGIGLPGTGKVYFGVDHPTLGVDLWELDPLASTATRIDLSATSYPGPYGFVANNNQFAFIHGNRVWISSGTQATTVSGGSTPTATALHPLPTLPGFFVGESASSVGVEPHLFASSSIHWLLRDIWQPLAGATQGSSPWAFAELHGQFLFQHTTAGAGSELWRTDGTASGTVIVRDIVPGATGSGPRLQMRFGEHLYGTANAGSRFWRTDGTQAGTVEIPRPGGGIWFSSWSPGEVLGGRMIFEANDELWQSDGTNTGTGLLRDINPAGPSHPREYTVVGGTLFFTADNEIGPDLWKTDGTFNGTVRVKDIVDPFPPYYSPTLSGLESVGSTLFFYAPPGMWEGAELWKSDGTEAGTVLVKDIYPGPSGGLEVWSNGQASTASGVLVFAARDRAQDDEVWRSDGTANGTFRLADIMPGEASSRPSGFFAAFGFVYFTAESPGIGRELWESNGTIAGTHLVANVGTGAYSGDPSGTWQLGSRYLWFSASVPGVGRELFAYEPWSQVVFPMGDFQPGSGSGDPRILGLAGPNLFVAADDGLHGDSELFVLDGVATSYTFGTGCGPSAMKPGLLVTDPRLGSPCTFSAFGFPQGQFCSLVIGTRAFPPTSFGGCPLYIGQQLNSVGFVAGPTSFVFNLSIPNDLSYIGVSLAAQAASLSPSGELSVTNGAHFTVGL